MKKKKGFTLMELLASIVIMGVIALILVPVVSGIIEKTRKSAFSRSADSILRISNEYYSNNNTSFLNTGARNFSCNNIECKTTIIDEDGNDKDEILKTEGAMGNGYVKIYEKGEVEFLLSNGTYCAAKNPLKEDIKVYNGTCDNIIMDNQKIKIENVETTSTTRSITVKVTVSAGVSGISGYQFYIDGTWGKFIESLDSTYEYTFDELREKKHEIKVRVYNGTYGRQEFDEEIGMDESKLISVELSDFGDITITSSSKNWETSKTYILDGTTTGATLQYKVVSGTTVKQDWTNYSSAITVNWTSTTTNPTYIYARFNDGYNTSGETTHIETKIDTTAPVLTLGSATTTTKSIMIPITVNKDDESGIKSTTCVYGTSTSYGSTGTVSNNKCTISNIKNNTTYYYKVTTTNNAGLQTTKTGSNKTGETAITFNPITQVPTNTTYAQSKTVTINYTATNVTNPTYYVKTTVATTSTMNGYSCGIETNPGTCSTTATKNYAANTWYKVTGNLSITFKENGEIIARINDGESYSSAETLVITKIDATAPVLTLGSATTTTKSIMIPITVNKDDESGIKSTTCVYGTSTSYGSTGTVSNNKCTISNIKNNTTYYYKVTTTNNAGLQTTKTGSNKTGETAITFNPITQVPTNTTYAQSKTVTINYTATNVTNPTYYVKTTVATTSTMNGYSCGIETNPGTCSTTATKNYAANTWYKVTGNLSITFKENGEIIARINDGESYSSAETLVITKIDTTAPTVTLTKGTVTTNSITVVANAKDAESGIKNYQFSIDDGSTWTALQTSNTYKFTGLKSGTTYKLKAKTNNNANLSATSSTLSVTTSTLACPTFEESPTGWATKKTVTIKYPSESIANTYSIDNGTTWTTYTTALTFTANGTVTAKASDGTNTCQTSRSIVVDTSTPSLTISAVKSTSGTAVSSGSWSNETLKYAITSTGTNPSGVTIKYCVDTNNTCTPSTTIASGTTFSLNNTGTYYVRYQGTTGAGKTNSVASYTAMVDKVLPTVSYNVSSGIYNTNKTVRVTANDVNYSYMKVRVYNNEAKTYTNYITAKSNDNITAKYFDVVLDSDGPWTIYAAVFDKAGNKQSQSPNNGWWYYQTYTIDTTAPTVTLTKGTVTTNSITVVANATDAESGIKNYQFSIDDGATWTTLQTSNTYKFTGLKSGTTYKLKAKVYNNANLSATSSTLSVTTSTLACPTFEESPTGWATKKTVTIKYPSESIANTYSIDNGTTWTTYTTALSFTANGTVTAKSSDGTNVCQTSRGIVVDTVKPSNITLSTDTTWTKSKNITLTLKDTGGSGLAAGKIKYGWSTSNTTAPTSYTEVSYAATTGTNTTTVKATGSGLNGQYYLWVVPVTYNDNAGNSNTTTIKSSATYKFDGTVPTNITLSTDTTWTKSKNITLTLKDTGGSGLAAGTIKYGWSTSNTTAPTSYTEVSYAATTGTNTTTVTATGSGLNGQYYLWVVPVTYKDNAGNSNTTTIKSSAAYKFDNTAPSNITLSTDTTWTKSKSITLTLKDTVGSGLAAGKIKYGWSTSNTTAPASYTEASYAATTGTNATTVTASGSGLTGQYYLWVVPVTYKDNAGNSNTTTIKSSAAYKFDNTAPTVTLTKGTVTTNSITVVANAKDAESGIKNYQFSIDDGSTWTALQTSNTYKFTGLKSGTTYKLKAKTNNNANLSATSSTLSVTTSTLACPTFEESPTGWATKKTVTIKYPSESIANTYSIDNGTTWTTYTTALTFTANGTVTAKASDGTNTCQTSRSIVVDTSTPSLTISAVKSTSGTAVSSGSWSNETLKYAITSTGTNPSGVTIKYCVDTNNTCTPSTTIASGTTFSLNNTGTYYVRYQGTTGAGKTNSVASYKAMVDTVRPTVSMSPSGGTYSSYKTVTVTANDTNYLSMAVHVYKNSALVYSGKVDGKSTNSTSSSYFDVALDSEGTWTIYTTAYDKALNTQNQNPNNGSWYYQEYTIDSIGPLDITMSSDTAWTKSKNITLTLQDGGGTGLAAGKIKYGWSTSNTTAPTSYTEVSYAATTGTNTTTVTASGSGLNGQYYLWVVPVTYKDNAGNSNSKTVKSSAAYKFDSTAPTLSVSVPNGTTVATSKTATITIKDTGGSGLTAGTYNIYYGWGSSASNACSNMTTYKTITTTAGSSSASTTVTLNAGTGNYNIYVCNKDVAIKDVAGNTLSANTRQSVSAYLDNTRPTVSMSPSGGTYSSYKTVTVTASDTNFDHMDVQVYKGKTLQSSISKNSITSTTYDVSLNSDAVWTIYVKAYDKAGNTQSQTPQNDSGYYYQEYTINTTKLLVLNGLNIDNGWVGDANNINLQANCPSGVTNYVFDIYDLNYPDRIATTKTVGSTATSITYLFTSNLSEMTYPFPATDHYGQPITINQKFKGSLKINLSCKNASGTTIASTSRTVQIDTTPVLSLYSANATTTSFDAVISIKNLGSGINHVYYAKGHGTTESLDNGTSTTRTFTGFTSCSYHYITAHVINNVGLTGSISTYLWTGGCDSSSGSTYCGGTAGGIVNTATNVNCGTINGCPAYATVYTCKDGTNTGYVGCSPKCS